MKIVEMCSIVIYYMQVIYFIMFLYMHLVFRIASIVLFMLFTQLSIFFILPFHGKASHLFLFSEENTNTVAICIFG